MFRKSQPTRHAFSLIELVVVVVIIGIIAAIAIPKMSKGAQGAADSALTGDLALLRQAIDMYANEHGGALPSTTTIATQLTQYTNAGGNLTSATKDTTANQIVYGPYLRAIPPMPVNGGTGNATKGLTTIGLASTTPGWVYDGTGTVVANSTANDANGVAYSTY